MVHHAGAISTSNLPSQYFIENMHGQISALKPRRSQSPVNGALFDTMG
jgi:hypothetical protein